jgi:hypothetical protein
MKTSPVSSKVSSEGASRAVRAASLSASLGRRTNSRANPLRSTACGVKIHSRRLVSSRSTPGVRARKLPSRRSGGEVRFASSTPGIAAGGVAGGGGSAAEARETTLRSDVPSNDWRIDVFITGAQAGPDGRKEGGRVLATTRNRPSAFREVAVESL